MADYKRDDRQGDSKRLRTSEGMEGSSSTPSRVLHVRNVSPETSHEELVAFVSQFGGVTAICFLSKFQQALVEMDTVTAASAVVMYSKGTPVFIKGREVHFEFSKSQTINTNAVRHQPPSGQHHILLCTIVNPIYNITVDVIWAIMSPYGNVLRIVVFNKNGVQSLVEFESAASAASAFTALDGKDIYAGSCTLKIEFSRSEKLNVHVNNDKSRDFTNPNLPSTPSIPGGSTGLGSSMGMGASLGNSGTFPNPLGSSLGSSGGITAPYGVRYGYPNVGPPPGMTVGGIPGTVFIVYGLEESITVDRLFNLICQYGNVVKIKLITHKKGSGMVQMESPDGSDRAIQALTGLSLFGQQLSFQYSKHGYIAESRNDVEQAAQNPTSPPSTKDFSSSPLNRFKNPNNPNAYKNIYKPTNTLYFSNAPREYQDDDLTQLFANQASPAPKPTAIKFFALNATGMPVDERRVGLLEFTDIRSAAEALVTVNNTKVGQHTIKLSFTANTINPASGAPPGLNKSEGLSSSSSVSASAI